MVSVDPAKLHTLYNLRRRTILSSTNSQSGLAKAPLCVCDWRRQTFYCCDLAMLLQVLRFGVAIQVHSPASLRICYVFTIGVARVGFWANIILTH